MKNYPYKIYCDMDGVLCDFEKAVVESINRELASENPKHPKIAAKAAAVIMATKMAPVDPPMFTAATEYAYAPMPKKALCPKHKMPPKPQTSDRLRARIDKPITWVRVMIVKNWKMFGAIKVKITATAATNKVPVNVPYKRITGSS